MLITRECDYAVRVVRALAGGRRFPVADICAAEHIPQPYAYKILKKLEKADIVNSFRGPAGGYELAKHTTEISLLDIFLAVEDELYLNSCMQEGYDCPNNCDGDSCKVHMELQRIQHELAMSLKKRTMADIILD